MDELAGRGAVVLGSGGIGRGIALGLSAEGMKVCVADLAADTAEAVAAEIADRGGETVARQADATSTASLEELAGEVADRFGGVAVLASTVGVMTDRRLDHASEEDWAWLLEFNVMASVRSVNAFLPHLRASAGGAHVVLTSSIAGLVALGAQTWVANTRDTPAVSSHIGVYTTTKHALVGYADMLRSELAPEGIGVSVLCPGLVAGRLVTTSAENRPERYGGPTTPPSRTKPLPGAMPGEDVGPIVVRGIKADRFYIFTHPDAVTLVEQRHAGVLDDFRFYADTAHEQD